MSRSITRRSALAHAAPDGYTTGMTSVSTHGINPNLFKARLPFKALDDFEFLPRASEQPNFICCHPSIPAQNVAEFIACLKANPNKKTYASSGLGTSIHLCAELFMQLAGVKPQRGTCRSTGAEMRAKSVAEMAKFKAIIDTAGIALPN